MMSNQMLIVFAIFADRIENGHDGKNVSVEKAMAVFAFLLFVTYGSFAALLMIFQGDIVKDGENYYFWVLFVLCLKPSFLHA